MKLVIYLPKSPDYRIISNNMVYFDNNHSVYSWGFISWGYSGSHVWADNAIKYHYEALHNALVKANKFNTVVRRAIRVEFKQIN